MNRVTDMADEVNRQLGRLKRQVKSAEKFKRFREDKERLESELLLLRYRRLEVERAACEKQVHDSELDLEKARAALFEVEAKVEEKRALVNEHGDEINRMKEEHYQLGARISSEEKDIETHRKSIERVREEQAQVKQSIDRNKQAMDDRREVLVEQERRCEDIDKETETPHRRSRTAGQGERCRQTNVA